MTEDARSTNAALSKLKWRCRRGLLENDLFIERFFERHEATPHRCGRRRHLKH